MNKLKAKQKELLSSILNLLVGKIEDSSFLPEKYQKKTLKLLKNPHKFFEDSSRLKFVNNFVEFTSSEKMDLLDYQIHNLDVAETNLNAFELIGDNWINGSNKPIAVLWGFHPWKRAIVSEFLIEYRLAFSNTNTEWSKEKLGLNYFENLTFVFWGMNANEDIYSYALTKNIKILRMEDGFIRSAELGSHHSLPMSLVVDDDSLYFNASRSSRLEKILKETEFADNTYLMESSQALINVYKALKISKYNIKSYKSIDKLLGIKIKKRILVIGQVESDASLKYGNLNSWNDESLIELAVLENPDCEVIYKPHPDVLEGFRKSNFSKNYKVKTINEKVNLHELFESIDRVYTITSLAGFEAILFGLSVTVVGAPFYAGWGLTDDRCTLPNRQRNLSVTELFCGAYLLYPRYITDLLDPVRGCLAAMFSITNNSFEILRAEIEKNVINDVAIREIPKTKFWPIIFRPENLIKIESTYNKKIFSALSLEDIFMQFKGSLSKEVVSYFLVGKSINGPSYSKLLSGLRPFLHPTQYLELMTILYNSKPSPVILENYAWINENIGNLIDAEATLNYLAFSSSYNIKLPQPKAFNNYIIEPKKFQYILKLAQLELKKRNLDLSEKLFKSLLLSNYIIGDVFLGLADIARLRFDFISAAEIISIFNNYQVGWKLGRANFQESIYYNNALEPNKSLDSLINACFINPTYIESMGTLQGLYNKSFGFLPYAQSLVSAVGFKNNKQNIGLARALISTGSPDKAETVLRNYQPSVNEKIKYCLTLSSSYIYQGKLTDARELIENLLKVSQNIVVFREALRISILQSDYEWGQHLLKITEHKHLDVGDIYYRKISLGMGEIKKSYLTFRNIRANKILKAHIVDKYIQDIESPIINENDSLLILAFFGPGDEIRFASKYKELINLSNTKNVTFTCDPRLLNLFMRSYPLLKFEPVERIRSLNSLSNYDKYNNLPASDLHIFLDNNGWELCQSSNYVTLVTDVIGNAIGDYSSFKGASYLKPHINNINYWKEKLPKTDKLLIGISWRSSLNTHSRNEHYLSVQDLAPIFQLSNIQFVNFQYDDCTTELEWVEENYPGKIINFPELDHYNDFENVTALMKCMHYVISPATTVVELAGAVGVPTLLLSNSSELHWRKAPETNNDVWQSSIIHIEGSILGNKLALVDALVDALETLN